MTNYDIAAGLDEATLNELVGQLHQKIYPSVLRGSFYVGALGIASVGFDIDEAPTARLVPSSAARTQLKAEFDNLAFGGQKLKLSDEDRAALLELAAQASFELTAPSVKLNINYSSGGEPTVFVASLDADLTVVTSTSGGADTLTAEIVRATVTIPKDPDFAEVLNRVFVPQLILYLNENLLRPIQVPLLQFGSLTVSLPAPAVQTPNLVAYSALGTAQPDVPPPSAWPSGCVFIGTDAAALTAAVGCLFPIGPSEGFNFKIISGSVGAQIKKPSAVVISGDGSVTATIEASAWANLKVRVVIKDFTFGPTATAGLTATMKPSVVHNQLKLTIVGCPIPTFDFHWGVIPRPIEWLVKPLLNKLAEALNSVLGPLINDALAIPPIPVHRIPTIAFTIGGTEANVVVEQAATSARKEGNSLLLVNAQMGIV
jgi:hypothetical protein